MAIFDIKLFSTSLLTNTDILVIIPTPGEPFFPDNTPYYDSEKKYQVLYLLHGTFGDCTVWTRNTGIERYVQDYKLAVVMASATNSWYMDMAHGGKFLTYMTKELPEFVHSIFPLSKKREDNFIAGISMGGYGAYHIALEDPGRFACAASLSGAIDIAAVMSNSSNIIPPINFKDIFGDPVVLEGGENDIFAQIGKYKARGIELPRFYQCCGTEDFLYQVNQIAYQKLRKLQVDITYNESPGIHNWDYWDENIKNVLAWLPLAGTLVTA
jgi:S-formylglutathione hydrolase FrmB